VQQAVLVREIMRTIWDPPSVVRWSVCCTGLGRSGDSVEDLSSGGRERDTRADHKDVDTQATFG
jgi:hypothetical protein